MNTVSKVPTNAGPNQMGSKISEFHSFVPSKLYLIFMSCRLIVCCSTLTCYYNIYVGTRYDMILLLGRPGPRPSGGAFSLSRYIVYYIVILLL